VRLTSSIYIYIYCTRYVETNALSFVFVCRRSRRKCFCFQSISHPAMILQPRSRAEYRTLRRKRTTTSPLRALRRGLPESLLNFTAGGVLPPFGYLFVSAQWQNEVDLYIIARIACSYWNVIPEYCFFCDWLWVLYYISIASKTLLEYLWVSWVSETTKLKKRSKYTWIPQKYIKHFARTVYKKSTSVENTLKQNAAT
jgi:hypothetical protein